MSMLVLDRMIGAAVELGGALTAPWWLVLARLSTGEAKAGAAPPGCPRASLLQ
jgi:hypothetical protein